MKFKGTTITEPSGSVGGLTFSHNTYGYYVRNRVMPTNPASPLQQQVRAKMTSGHRAWEALPQVTKDAWAAYAAGTPIADKLGMQIFLTGRQMYMRDYILRCAASVSLPPIVVQTMGLTQLGTCALSITAPAAGSMAYVASDPWCTTTGGILFIALSRAQSLYRNWFKGPYQTMAVVFGNTAAPPAGPKVFATTINYQAGQKVFFRCIASDAEGRLSDPFLGSCICS